MDHKQRINLVVLFKPRIAFFLHLQLMVGLLCGQNSARVTRHAAKEGKLEPANAPTHRLQEEGRTARENTNKPKNAKFDRAKVWIRDHNHQTLLS